MSVWEHRELCPDGGCVGVIGDDGLCKVCGKPAPNWGNERLRGMVGTAVDAGDAVVADGDDDEYEDDDENDDEDDDEDAPEDQGPATSLPAGWDDRKLCIDGACVGVLNERGTCNVCGKSVAT